MYVMSNGMIFIGEGYDADDDAADDAHDHI